MTCCSLTLTASMSTSNRLPACYDIFTGTKIHGIIQHPPHEGDKIFLKVPFSQSSQVKSLGAKFGSGQRMEFEQNNISGLLLNVWTNVSYTRNDIEDLKTHEARDRRWWYHSLCAHEHESDVDTELLLIVDAHRQSAFREFELDLDFIREMKTKARFTGMRFSFHNPSKMRRDG